MKKIVFLLLITLFINSCNKRYSEPKPLNCDVPQPTCEATQWNGFAIDTTLDFGKVNGFYYQIRNITDLNTDGNEYHLAFDGLHNSYLTSSDASLDHVSKFRRVDQEHFTKLKDIDGSAFGHLGQFSFADDRLFFTSNKVNITNSFIQSHTRNNVARLPHNSMMGQSRIFISKFSNKKFDDKVSNAGMVNFSADLDNFDWESQPSLSPNQKVMFFASNRNGSKGGTDIFFSYIKNNKWSKPISLGKSVNTICNELSPFVSKDGKYLYFSSAGRDNIGGYDLFKAKIDAKFYKDYDLKYISEASNLRSPINTKYDELFPSSPSDVDSILYYSSNQPDLNNSSNQNFDIYVVKKREVFKKDVITKRKEDALEEDNIEIVLDEEEVEIIANITNVPSIRVEGKVINSDTKKPVADIDLVVSKLDDDKIIAKHTTNKDGEYSFELKKIYDVEVLVEDEKTLYDNFIITKKQMDTITVFKRDLYISTKLTLRINFPYDDYSNPYKFVLDSNGKSTEKLWEKELDNLAENIIKTISYIKEIKLTGHTDLMASQAYNQTLGENRVKFIVSELIKRNVPKELLRHRSAGENEAIPQKADEKEEDYHKRLRRVSVEKILK